VRDIAAKASIDPALVIRYFGSKDELFVRAAAFDLRMPDLSKVKRSQTSNAKGELSARACARYGV
jgi:AcrR family transcriptional regulator